MEKDVSGNNSTIPLLDRPVTRAFAASSKLITSSSDVAPITLINQGRVNCKRRAFQDDANAPKKKKKKKKRALLLLKDITNVTSCYHHSSFNAPKIQVVLLQILILLFFFFS